LIIGMVISRYLLPGGILLSQGLPQTLSTNILELTQPVYNFSGQVERVNGDTLVVKQTQNRLTPPLLNGQDQSDTPQPKTITYNVKTDSSTNIIRQSIVLVNTPTSASPSAAAPALAAALTLADIKTGDYVSISSTQDLRVLSGNTFTANSVGLSPAVTSVLGQITKIDQKMVTVSGSPVGGFIGSFPGLQEYRFNISGNTQINRRTGTRTTKIGLKDLNIGQQVSVNASQALDVSGVNEAATVEVVEGPPLAPPIAAPPVGSGAAQLDSR